MEPSTNLLFDIENLIFACVNKNRELIKLGRVNPRFNFPYEYYAEPILETTLKWLPGVNFNNYTVRVVVGKQNYSLVSRIKKYPVDIASEPFCHGIGNQAADLHIKKLLDEWCWDLRTGARIILASGDGGYLNKLLRMCDRGFEVQVIAPEWTLHREYPRQFGTLAIPLHLDWLEEVRENISRTLSPKNTTQQVGYIPPKNIRNPHVYFH